MQGVGTMDLIGQRAVAREVLLDFECALWPRGQKAAYTGRTWRQKERIS
jgi:hypothetical protein